MTEKTFGMELVASPVGTVVIVTDAQGAVVALDWEDCAGRLARLLRARCGSDPLLLVRDRESPAAAAVRRYFAGHVRALDALDVEFSGTTFQRSVWAALRRIPVGTRTSYASLASGIGRPRAVRAVARANATNPVSLLVPCHRVIGSDGSLTGYAGGLARKQWLLEHEARWAAGGAAAQV